jgi:hypothetical protein
VRYVASTKKRDALQEKKMNRTYIWKSHRIVRERAIWIHTTGLHWIAIISIKTAAAVVSKGTTFASDWHAAPVTTHDAIHNGRVFDLLAIVLHVTATIVNAAIDAFHLAKLTVNAALPYEIRVQQSATKSRVRWRIRYTCKRQTKYLRTGRGSKVSEGAAVSVPLHIERSVSQVKPEQQCSSKLQPLLPSSRQHTP